MKAVTSVYQKAIGKSSVPVASSPLGTPVAVAETNPSGTQVPGVDAVDIAPDSSGANGAGYADRKCSRSGQLSTGIADLIVSQRTCGFERSQGLEQGSNPLSQINRELMYELCSAVAKANLPFFVKEVEDVNSKFAHGSVEMSPKEFVDDFGRMTHFIVQLGPYVLPLWQPGTPMFVSAMLADCQYEVRAKNSQQNGPILGVGCAKFLCEFYCKLVDQFHDECRKIPCNVHNPDPSCIPLALETTLRQMCMEDTNEHGRFIELKNELDKLLKSVRGPQPSEGEPLHTYLLLKATAVKAGKPPCLTPADVQTLIQHRLSHREVETLMKEREQSLCYRGYERVLSSGDDPRQILETVRDGLLAKTGIVPKQAEVRFRSDVGQICTNLLEQAKFIAEDPSRGQVQASLCKERDEQRLYDEYMSVNALFRSYSNNLGEDIQKLLDAAKHPSTIESPLSTSLNVMSQHMPSSFGAILKGVSNAVVERNEQCLHEKLSQITRLVEYSKRDFVTKSLTMKLALRRRNFIANITKNDLKKLIMPGMDFESARTAILSILGLKDVHPEVFVAKVDSKMVLSCMLSISDRDVRTLQAIVDPGTRSSELVDKITHSFENAQVVSTCSTHCEPGEVPISFEMPSEALDESLFLVMDTTGKPILPKAWKMHAAETLQEWEERVSKLIKTVSPERFTAVMDLADYTNPKTRKLCELIEKASIDREPAPRLGGCSSTGSCSAGDCALM
eukprot:TRINITY_DN6011_c0_g1_i3.p1 TRINITY_DN6011_c0_g1~~TRINITY_DN6011_c0_g1_i3.p1  ORF type:complete len:762 (-),score=84.67 TRINITY_DN6011_c0_g1_i3:44-2242(-)